MKRKLIIRFMLIAILAVLIGGLCHNYLRSLSNNVHVYIVNENVSSRTILTEEMIESVEIGFEEKVLFFDRAFNSKEAIVGRVATRPLKKGEVLVNDESLIEGNDSVIDANGFVKDSYFIEDNMRIGFISLDLNNALGGDIKKDDLIDIIFTSMSNDTGGLYTTLLLQKVVVLDVMSNSNSNSHVDIQLSLTPDQALILSLAKYNGRLDVLKTDLNTPEIDNIPILPEVLYEKLLANGYQLIEESNNSKNEYLQGDKTTEQLNEELKKIESNLTAAFDAMVLVKEAIKTQNEGNEDMNLKDMILSLEDAIQDLENSVNDNKQLIKQLEYKQNGED